MLLQKPALVWKAELETKAYVILLYLGAHTHATGARHKGSETRREGKS